MRRTFSEGETMMDQIRATRSHFEQKKTMAKESEARIDTGLGKPGKEVKDGRTGQHNDSD